MQICTTSNKVKRGVGKKKKSRLAYCCANNCLAREKMTKRELAGYSSSNEHNGFLEVFPPHAALKERLFESMDPDESEGRASLLSRFTKTGFEGASSSCTELTTCGASALGGLLTGRSTGDAATGSARATSTWRDFAFETEASMMSMPPSLEQGLARVETVRLGRGANSPSQRALARHLHQCFQKHPNHCDRGILHV